MFPNDPPPISTVASQPLSQRCLALTGSFETGKYPPDCFCRHDGRFRSNGPQLRRLAMECGAGNSDSLLLMQMFDQHTT